MAASRDHTGTAPDFFLTGFFHPEDFIDDSMREEFFRHYDAEDGNYDVKDVGEIKDAAAADGTPEHDLNKVDNFYDTDIDNDGIEIEDTDTGESFGMQVMTRRGKRKLFA